MNAVEITGTLREDCTLVLYEKPNLPPGRSKVQLRQQEIIDTGTDAVSVLARIHASQPLFGTAHKGGGK